MRERSLLILHVDVVGQTGNVQRGQLGLDQRHSISQELRQHGSVVGVDPFQRNFLFQVGNLADGVQAGGTLVRCVGNAVQCDHFAGVALKSGLGGSTAHLVCLGDIGTAGQVASAALQGGKLNAAGLGVQIAGHHVGQIPGGAGQGFVAERVNCVHIVGQLADIAAISQFNAFGNSNHDGRLFFLHPLHFFHKAVYIKGNFGQADHIHALAVLTLCQGGSGGQPARVTAHALDDGDHAGVVDVRVAGDFHDGGRDILGGGRIARAVVGAEEIVVDGLGDAHDAALVADLLHILGDLVAGIHGVVAAVVAEIADIVLLEDLKNALVIGIVFIRVLDLVAAGAEGGANIFSLSYFGEQAYLAQSPQFYKQMMVGVFERVYEIAPVFRAEKHDTARHLNEYTSVDFEIGHIENFEDIMAMEQEMLRYTFARLQETCGAELSLLKAEVPVITEIPRIRFSEAKELVSRVYKRAFSEKLDFEPEEEKLLCEYVKKTTGSDFVFVTHYPSAKRPFYAMDSRENPAVTESFDLLFRGLEVTTGGQRIHNYREQVEKIESRGMHVEAFESYLMMHRCGMPPHGGLGLGLERFTARLLGFENVRNASLFPRDIHRLIP